MGLNIFARLRALLALPDAVRRELRSLERAVERAEARAAKAGDAERKNAARAVEQLRKDLEQLTRQLHLQMARLTMLAEGRSAPAALGGRLPLDYDGPPAEPLALPDDPRATSNEWLSLTQCPTCGTKDRTVVCEWNKLVLLETAPDARAWRYNYAVCHGCGLLYATERPHGSRYGYLVEHFEDVIDKKVSNPLLNPHPLTDEDRARYRALLAPGVFVSDHESTPHLGGVFRDRIENAVHVELLGSLLELRGKRVLEVRSRAGTIVEGLRRLHGADVCAMPIWESQQFIVRELYGIPVSDLIDFDHFTIPFEGWFDLILCNHLFNHAVHLDQFLDTVYAALKPGGYLYLYNEIDDSEFLDGNQSMVATMNPLHLQACDRASLLRALGARGFDPVFIKTRSKRHLCLMRRLDAPRWTPMTDAERLARIERYQRARDRAVLRAPEAVRARFADEWAGAVDRAVRTGVATLDAGGAVRIIK